MTSEDIDRRLALEILHFLQLNTGPQYRHLIAAEIAQIVRRILEEQPPASTPISSAMTDAGFVPLGRLLSPEQAAEAARHLEQLPCYNAHVPNMSDGVPRQIGQGAEAFHYGSYSLADVIGAPHLIELANRADVIDAAAAYLGCTPTIYALNAWWSFSGHGVANYAQSFHRDLDDYRFCTLFCFLTDVGPRNGAHVFLKFSHRIDLIERLFAERGDAAGRSVGRRVTLLDLFDPPTGYGKDEFYRLLFSGLDATIMGPAGFAFMADTGGLHKGEPLTEGRRLMFWARYGVYRNPVAASDPAPRSLVEDRIGRDARTRYINRCIVA